MLIQDMLSGFIAISAIPLIYPVEPTPERTKQACHRPIAHFPHVCLLLVGNQCIKWQTIPKGFKVSDVLEQN